STRATAAGAPASPGRASIARSPGASHSRSTADCAPRNNAATLPRAVFEIGNSLREARVRRGIEIAQAELATKIRAKYLKALEEEHFEVLPGETYVKGFLRTYAEYLGLDGQLYLDQFNSRFTREEEPLAPPRPRRQTSRSRAVESNFVIVALAGIIAITILVVVAWKFGSSGAEPTTPQVGGAVPPTDTTGTTSRQDTS